MEEEDQTEQHTGKQANSISSRDPHDAPAAAAEEEPAGDTVVFQSRLQAKRLERMQQRQSKREDDQQEPSKSVDLATSEEQQSTVDVRPQSPSKSGAMWTATTTTATTTPLTGMQTLGLDVASFAYKSRDEFGSR